MNPVAFPITSILVLIHFLILVIVIVPSHDSVCLRFEINLFDLPQTVYRHPAVRVDVTICPLNLHSSSETIYDPHNCMAIKLRYSRLQDGQLPPSPSCPARGYSLESGRGPGHLL